MLVVNAPDDLCIISKCSDLLIGVSNTDVVENIGINPIVFTLWINIVGSTGVFLGKTIQVGAVNNGNTFDGTQAGFEALIRRCFPELYNAVFTPLGTNGMFVIFPEDREYDCFEFTDTLSASVGIVSTANQGTNTVVKDCYYTYELRDESNEVICEESEPQYPNVSEDGIVSDTCFSNWNVFQETQLPNYNNISNIRKDDTFCSRFKYVIREYCADANAKCGYSVSEIAETDFYSVVNSVEPCDIDFSKFCLLEQFNNGNLGCFITSLDCIDVCRNTTFFTWIKPNLFLLDGINYDLTITRTLYYNDGTAPTTSISTIPGSNASYIVSQYISSLASQDYITLELSVNAGAGDFTITQPITINVKDCKCDDLVIHFQEQLGNITPICIKCVTKKTIENTSSQVCYNNGIADTAHEAKETWEIEGYCYDEKLLKAFALSSKHWIIEGDIGTDPLEWQSISIVNKVIDYNVKDDTNNIKLTIQTKKHSING